MWGVSETRKAPKFEGASVIFGAGQKRAPSVVSENARPSQHGGSCFVKVLCLDCTNIAVGTATIFLGYLSKLDRSPGRSDDRRSILRCGVRPERQLRCCFHNFRRPGSCGRPRDQLFKPPVRAGETNSVGLEQLPRDGN